MWARILISIKEVGGKILSSKLFWYLAAALGVYFIVKNILAKDKFVLHDLPDSGSGLPKGWGTQQANLLAAEGNDVIDGLLTLGSSKEIWASKLVALTNDQLTLVYDAYNIKYGKTNDETLTEAMNNEWNNPGGNSNWRKVIDKLRELKLY